MLGLGGAGHAAWGAMKWQRRDMGFFIVFDFLHDALQEIARE